MSAKKDAVCMVLGFGAGVAVGYLHGRDFLRERSPIETIVLALPAATYGVVGVHHKLKGPQKYGGDITELLFTIGAGAGLGAAMTAAGYAVGYVCGRVNS